VNVLDFGVKAADSWKRAGDIVESVGGTAKLGEDAEKWVMRNWGELGSKAHAIHVTADTLKDRFTVAVAKEFGDSTLYRAGAGLLDKPFQKLMPTLVENTSGSHSGDRGLRQACRRQRGQHGFTKRRSGRRGCTRKAPVSSRRTSSTRPRSSTRASTGRVMPPGSSSIAQPP
jgi:hypothetical protein